MMALDQVRVGAGHALAPYEVAVSVHETYSGTPGQHIRQRTRWRHDRLYNLDKM